jgi:hypothetical protein
MEQIETYIFSGKSFLGKGKFNSMPRVGETIYPIKIGDDLHAGKVTEVRNWNYAVDLPWQGITVINVVIEEQIKNEEYMKLGK